MYVCAHSTVQDSGTARPRRRTLRHIKPHWLGARVSNRVHRVRRMRHVKPHRLGTRPSNRIDLAYVYHIAYQTALIRSAHIKSHAIGAVVDRSDLFAPRQRARARARGAPPARAQKKKKEERCVLTWLGTKIKNKNKNKNKNTVVVYSIVRML